jgi:ubiquitin thioesterase OTU1
VLINEKTSISKERIQVLTGFPPSLISGFESDRIEDKGILSGSVITVRDGDPTIKHSEDEGGGKRPKLIPTVLSRPGNTQPNSTALLSLGFDVATCTQALDIANNDDLKLAIEVCEQLQEVPRAQNLQIFRRIIDADNSCLFNAIGYAIMRDKKSLAVVLRDAVAETVLVDSDFYSTEVLGQSPENYAAWIRNPEKWGGEIDMNILSKHLQLEIAAVDVQTGLVYVYGSEENGYTARIYLLYDGIHYDAIAFGNEKNPELDDITLFSPKDVSITEDVKALAADLRTKKQFVNLAGCAIQCLVCKIGLKGQKEAQLHASQTGHQNFGQVDV